MGARAGVMAGGAPLAALLQADQGEGEAVPRLIRLPVLFRLAFALMLFGRDYETSFLAAGTCSNCPPAPAPAPAPPVRVTLLSVS